MGIVQENEIYISNDRLCFLFSLLINNGAKISCENQHQADNFINNFKVFVSEIMETYVMTKPQHQQEQITREMNNINTDNIPSLYDDWYEITYSDENKVLIITPKDSGRLLNETLNRYTSCHWGDELSAWDNTNHFCSIKLCKDFYNKIEDYNCKDFSTNDINDIQAIVLGYYKSCLKVLDIECNIDLSLIDDMLFIPFYEEYPTDNVTHFVCKFDAREFKKIFNEKSEKHLQIGAKKRKNNVEKKSALDSLYHLEEQQWKIWFCIDISKRVLSELGHNIENTMIIPCEIFSITKITPSKKYPDKAISCLCDKIWQIVKDKHDRDKHRIIKKQADNCYIDINLYTQFNNILTCNAKLKQEKENYNLTYKLYQALIRQYFTNRNSS